MNFFVVLNFLVAISSIGFGLFVYINNTKSLVNKAFFGHTIAIFLWSFPYAIWLLQNTPKDALFWSRMLNFGAIFIPVTFFHWVLAFLHKHNEKKYKIFLSLAYFISIVFALFSFSDIYIKGVASVSIFPYWPQANWLYFIYLGISYVGLITFGGFLLFKNIRRQTGVFKEQLRYVFIGAVVGFMGGAMNFPFMLGIDLFLPVGNILILSFPILFTYAIIEYRLMDIKLVFRKSTVFIFSILSVILVATGIKLLYEHYIGWGVYTGDILMVMAAVILYDPVKDRFFVLANRYFFSTYYDTRKVISDISENLRSLLDTEKIYDYIQKRLGEAFHFTAFGVLSYDENKKEYRVIYNQGFDGGNKKFSRGGKKLYQDFIDKNHPIVVEEVKNMHKSGHVRKMIDYLEKMGVEVVAPLNSQDKNVGLLVFGPKESGDMYNEEDLEVIKIISSQAAVTIENARLYEETRKFNIKLKEEVEKATKNLKAANERLKRLDQAKTDFLSIASHQLRTPLTVIKGYISMLLAEDFGKLGKKQEQALKKVLDSSDRLIDLIEDLLNVSRMQSGRMEYNFKKSRLEDLVREVHEELKNSAEKKGLKFVINTPSKSLPRVSMDPEKMRQVVMNLADNAIKYTQKGSVTLNLSRSGNSVKFSVEDTGMGMTQEDIDNLFQKFSRNENADLVHTEGTGLGLYVAKQIAEAHGGKIWAESEGKGKGSKFCFTLPVKKNSKGS
jgi:signal transduction histidine kinase